MAGNPSLLETLKELQNLSRVVVQDPEDEDFEAGRISAFQETEEAEQKQDAKNNFGNFDYSGPWDFRFCLVSSCGSLGIILSLSALMD